jgi:hypothetical protein
VNCSAGFYVPAGSNTCAYCPAGSACNSTAGSPSTCRAGTYAGAGETSCTPCPAGSYCVAGSISPSSCSEGNYSSGAASACTPCPAGSYCSSTQVLGACPAGYSSVLGAGGCRRCPAGSACATAASLGAPCSAGSYAEDGATACTACRPGFRCPYSDSSVAVACAPGTFSLGSATRCTPCAAGSFCTNASSSSSGVCAPGSFSSSGASACTLCPAGFACPSTSNSLTVSCALGRYAAAGSTSCGACPPGYECPSPSRQPSPCGPGYFSDAARAACRPCLPGTSCPSAAAASPAGFCAPGSYAHANASACTLCPAGYSCSDARASTLQACRPGSYSLGGQVSCTSCPAGSYCPAANAAPLACSVGTYSVAGQTACAACTVGSDCLAGLQLPCPSGYYSVFNASVACQRCRAGTECEGGGGIQTPCPAGFYCPLGTNALVPSLDFGFSSAITLAPGAVELGNSSFTIQMWFYLKNVASSSMQIIFQTDSGGAQDAGLTVYALSGVLYKSYGGVVDAIIPRKIDVPKWFHLIIARDAAAECVYLNGGLEGCNVARRAGAFAYPTASFTLGGRSSGSAFFNGFLSDVVVYTGVCSYPTGKTVTVPVSRIVPPSNATVQLQLQEDTLVDSFDPSKALNIVGSPSVSVVNIRVGVVRQAFKMQCPGGTYVESTGSSAVSACVTCPAGYFCPAGSSTRFGICPPASYCLNGSALPTRCPAGTSNPYYGATSAGDCVACLAGRSCVETDGFGVAYDSPCRVGFYCPAGSTPQPCASGYSSAGLTNLSSSSQCKLCQAGQVCRALHSLVTSGGAGYAAFEYAKLGTYASGSVTSSANGYVSSRVGLSAPDYMCETGYACSGASLAATRGYECPVGKYSDSKSLTSTGSCSTCPAGSVCAVASGGPSRGPQPCKKGFFCPAGSVNYFGGNPIVIESMVGGSGSAEFNVRDAWSAYEESLFNFNSNLWKMSAVTVSVQLRNTTGLSKCTATANVLRYDDYSDWGVSAGKFNVNSDTVTTQRISNSATSTKLRVEIDDGRCSPSYLKFAMEIESKISLLFRVL